MNTLSTGRTSPVSPGRTSPVSTGRTSPTRRIVVGAVGLALLVGACGSGEETLDDSAGVAEAPTCVGVDGPQEVPDGATRVISLSSSFTEMIYAIDGEDVLFAVDTYSDFPAEAAAKEPRLDAYSPNIEAIAGYEPDAVLISYDPGSLKQQLCALGIAVWEGSDDVSLDEIYAQIIQIGRITGRTGEARDLVESMKTEIAAAVESVDVEPGTYYFEIDTTFYAFTSDSYQGELLALFGMTSIADSGSMAGASSVQMNAESILAADPDVILLGDTKYESQSAATVAARPGWDGLTAVSAGRVIELDDDIVSRWGPRTVDLVKAIAAGLGSID